MFLAAAVAGYVTCASLFYALITKVAPVQPDETLVRPSLYVIDGTAESDIRKAA